MRLLQRGGSYKAAQIVGFCNLKAWERRAFGADTDTVVLDQPGSLEMIGGANTGDWAAPGGAQKRAGRGPKAVAVRNLPASQKIPVSTVPKCYTGHM